MPRHFNVILALGLLLAGCSAGEEEKDQATAAAVKACEGKSNEVVIGMNEHTKCLIVQANKTRPANKQICSLAGSDTNKDGTCLFVQ